jgi:LPXTG-motif cell wall-anchored protein
VKDWIEDTVYGLAGAVFVLLLGLYLLRRFW